MTYTIYLDRLFVLNFSMNLLLLLPVKWILGCHASRFRICVAAAAGAAGYCVVLLFPRGASRGFWYALGCIIISAGMVVLCFGRKKGSFLKALYLLYGLSMVTGGGLMLLQRLCPMLFDKNAMAGILLGMAGVLAGVRQALLWSRKRKESVYEVQLTVDGQVLAFPGLFDTGNGLREPLGGKPVSVLDKEASGQIKGYIKPERFLVIPFRTVGREQGILYGARIERMRIAMGEESLVIDNPVVAFADRAFTAKGGFRILLHPDLRS